MDIEDVFRAAEKGDLETLKHLAEYSAVNMRDTDEQHNSALYYGVKSADLGIVRYLTERVGLDPAEGNQYGETPYDRAHFQKSKILLEYFSRICGFSYEESYHNPIRRGCFPDPSVVRVEGDYYMVNSTFCFFPCIPISHSKDLVEWNIVGYAITRPEYARLDYLEGGRGYWAPDISYSEGRFYVTATLRLNDGYGEKRIQMITSSELPEGPYDEPSWIHEDGIDPSIFHDLDGRNYMLLHRGARIMELSSDCRTKISKAKLLWYGDWKRTPEGPHLFWREGFYYLFMAEGGTGLGHRITVARSKTLMGNYEPCPHNPILYQWNENAYLQCCGHGKPVQLEDGSWCMVYLCLRRSNEGYGILGRESALAPLTWTSDGWPLIHHGRGPKVQQKRPIQNKTTVYKLPNVYPRWMGEEWMTPRPLVLERIKLDGNKLRLKGQAEDLNNCECRSVVVKRQDKFSFEAGCQLAIPKLMDGENLGLTCYYDENSYIKFGICNQGKIYGVILQEYVGNHYKNDQFYSFPETALIPGMIIGCKVKTEGLKRTFFCYFGQEWIEIDIIRDTSYLSSEGLLKGKRFTGATVGVYVHGDVWGCFTDWEMKHITMV